MHAIEFERPEHAGINKLQPLPSGLCGHWDLKNEALLDITFQDQDQSNLRWLKYPLKFAALGVSQQSFLSKSFSFFQVVLYLPTVVGMCHDNGVFPLKQAPNPFQEGVLLFTLKAIKTSFKECKHIGCTNSQCTENDGILYNHKILELKANRCIWDHHTVIILNNV